MLLRTLAGLCLVAAPASAHADDLAAARAALKAVPIIDGHNDLPWQLRLHNGQRTSDFNFGKLPERFRGRIVTDFEMMKAGGVGGQFWSVYVPSETEGPEAVRQTLEQIDIMQRLIDAHPDLLRKVGTAAEAERAMRAGKIASLFGAEGGHSIGNSLGVLRQLYALGVRYMTLTHGKTTAWADSATDAPRHDGLAPFGVEVVREMNRLGMLVDLSHVTPATMHDALGASAAPVIFSHSNAKALRDRPRNVPDDVLVRLKANRGVIMVYFAETSLSAATNDWYREEAAEKARLAYDFPDRPAFAEERLQAWRQANPMPKSTIAEVADHIDHIRKVAGIDAIGIGSDFDGLSSYPEGLETTADFPALFAELVRRGYVKAELGKIASGNILRVMREAEAVAARLQRERPPGETLLTP
jgi:membrane dipeptidase